MGNWKIGKDKNIQVFENHGNFKRCPWNPLQILFVRVLLSKKGFNKILHEKMIATT